MTKDGYFLYTSTTCTRCPLARRSMERAGIQADEIVLDTPGNEGHLNSFRAMMTEHNKSHEVPVLVTPNGDILSNLATISEHCREVGSVRPSVIGEPENDCE